MSGAAANGRDRPASAYDVRRVCGDLLDEDAVAILAVKPSLAELESGAIWAMTGDPAVGRPLLSGAATEVAEILVAIAREDDDVWLAAGRA